MFRKKLIEEIEKYLSDEYIEETKPTLSLFLNYMKLSVDEDTFEDDYYDDSDFIRAKNNVEEYIDDSLEEITFANKLNQYFWS